MITLKNILVATDFSETSEAAVALARQLAHAFGSTLHLLHVTANIVAIAGVEGYTADFGTMQREVEESARRQLDTIVTDDEKRTLSVKTTVLTSNSPAPTIVDYAKDANIDLIVVGTHGRGGVSHLLMGSVAERVVRTAPCPVLTVRPPAHASVVPAADRTVAHV